MTDESSGVSAPLPQEERVRLILESLKNAPTPYSIEGAIDLITQVVNDVENAYSGKPYDENPGFQYKGRMYGPKPDRVAEIPGGKVATTKGNFIYLFKDGSFVVTDVAGTVLVANVRKEVLR